MTQTMEREMPPRAAERLKGRARLPVDAKRSIAIKRDVHYYTVEVGAERFARGFAEAMVDPGSSFGLIRIKRPAARMGEDFELGERFQGCYSAAAAILGSLRRRPWTRGIAPAVERLLATPWVRSALARIEDACLSDYAIIDELVLDPDPSRQEHHHLRYSYLAGTPIAGSSRFTITPLGPNRCRVEQVLEYQEINGLTLAVFQTFGLKLHDQVVHEQMRLAAERAGAAEPKGTIPATYAA